MEEATDRVLPAAFLCALSRFVPLKQAWQWQRQWQRLLIRNQNQAQIPELLLLLEHPPCYTLGRGASEQFLGFDPATPPAPLVRLDRGGEVTHHLPGQLVAYPLLDLKRHRCDLHWYLRELEGAVIDVLAQLDLSGERRAGLTGVWLEGKKVAAIGVSARRWVTQHGVALNVNCELAGFAAIKPCGLELPVGGLNQWRPGCSVAQLQQPFADALAHRLQWRSLQPISEQNLLNFIDQDGLGLGALEW
ncbi:MAG: lipoyl(octanoyl) transferase LipB [Synechococcaceae bacterium WB8_1A_041]|nr:lipoyl(octanoyl) transferase LipB [Synechococcaceae bacterium WB6_1A_059]NBP32818.1 lipoyl(octanoyl) transferase LipB [Synechococcaceae bacterium WB6_1B_055]NBP98077.1 lipoyl(octanoyl) transferase LipB [Synechococcaceae bacterium WB6_3A_227]NBQ19159.1 lipoyl(octanoyl) transferase LipB [Synechococcaceae bacterium WB5_2A_257]NBY60341.1 lipoyl(octanoyl) transferase LipB [Synechococcaceae bacterium LLD_019]NCY14529.1 lipoyl(octanoyl) transferase LipB [Synechococcaceae bacterium WB8_1A_041]NDA7